MATVTLLDSSFDTNSGTHTVTDTPSVNDLIAIVVASTSYASGTAPTDNNSGGGGTYTRATIAQGSNSGAIELYIRDALITSATSTTFTHAPGVTTGGGLVVYRITGMSKAGSAAKRLGAGESFGSASTTPAVAIGTMLTSNPVISALYNGSNPGNVTVRSSPAYTNDLNTGYGTPTTGIVSSHINSGDTASTLTWGGTTATAYAMIAVEFDSSSSDYAVSKSETVTVTESDNVALALGVHVEAGIQQIQGVRIV